MPSAARAWALIFSLVGGTVIAVQGIWVIVVTSPYIQSSVSSEAFAVFILIAYFGSIGVLVSAVLLWKAPRYHLGIAILMILASLSSYLVGGGFCGGLILGIIGGALAMLPDTSNMSHYPRPQGDESQETLK